MLYQLQVALLFVKARLHISFYKVAQALYKCIMFLTTRRQMFQLHYDTDFSQIVGSSAAVV